MRTAWIVAATVLGAVCGPAGTALADQQNPLDVIEQYQEAGYTVNVDRIGSAPIEDCVVTGVRNPQVVTQNVRDRDDDIIEVVVHQSISVSLDCSG
jgi:hypothetical protein